MEQTISADANNAGDIPRNNFLCQPSTEVLGRFSKSNAEIDSLPLQY
jgi:hypothetical protein